MSCFCRTLSIKEPSNALRYFARHGVVFMVKLYGSETGLFFENEVNIMAADALAPSVAKPSAAMALTVQNYRDLVYHVKRLELLASSQFWEMVENSRKMRFSSIQFSPFAVRMIRSAVTVDKRTYFIRLVPGGTCVSRYGSRSHECCICIIDMWPLFLIHWSRDKMAAISQTTHSNVFSWTKKVEFCLKFHWSLFLRVQLTIFQHWFR